MIETKFKQTEIGLIPEDWGIMTIGEICSVKGRIGFRGYTVKDLISQGFGAISLSPSNITKHNELNFDNVTYISWYKYDESPEIKVSVNDILFVKTGSTYGKTALVQFLPEKATINPQFALFKNIVCNPMYLSLALTMPSMRKQVDECVVGGAVPTMSQKKIESFLFPLPKEKQEQSRIAEALSDIDKLIASLSKMIEKKRLMKQGAMQQLLTGKKRLPGFEGEWVEKRVGELLTIGNGRDYKHLKSGYVPVVGTGGVMAYVNDWLYDGETVCIGRKGTINKPIFYRGKIWTVDTLFYTYDFINTSPKYLYYLFDTIDWLSYNEATGVPSLSKANIERISVYLPHNIAEQSAIANVLTTMDNEIESLEEERDKYIQVKEGMKQKLLTGQIRLVETEAKVVAMPKAKIANVHFKRSVLAAEIANRLYEEPTFGHVKMEKLIFLTEHLCHIDTGSHYHRDAAGPYDNTALRSIDKQMKQHQWFALTKKDKGYRYKPMDKRGDHKKYFDKYYAAVLPMFDKVIETFKTSSTEQCEIVATLYSAWDDLQHRNQPFTDDDILNEVLNHWHESKKRIPRSRWQKALDWMRKNGFVPILDDNN